MKHVVPLTSATLLALFTLACTRDAATPRVDRAEDPIQSAGAGGGFEPHSAPGPNESQSFIVDPNQGGFGSTLSLLGASYGRLVDIYGRDASGRAVFQQRDFVIAPDVMDTADYSFDRNPITQRARLVIDRDVTDLTPGGGRDQFEQLVLDLDQGLVDVVDLGLPGIGLFSASPRDAALVLRFDDLLDETLVTSDTLRVLVGEQVAQPFEARLLIDRNHGGLAQHGGDPAPRFYSTRVIIDPTVSTSEAANSQPPLAVNQTGLPAAQTVNASNVAVRIPTRVNATVGQNDLLRSPSGRAVSRQTSGTVDLVSPTQDVVRALRSGGASAVTGDAYNGFLPDEQAPRLVGEQAVTLSQPINDPAGDAADFILPRTTFASGLCARTPLLGDVLEQGGFVLEVTSVPNPLLNGQVIRLGVRVVQGDPAAWPAVAAGSARYFTRLDATLDADRRACFIQVSPSATQAPSQPTRGISTQATLSVRLDEPLDLDSASASESLILGRAEVPVSGVDFVVSSLSASLDLSALTLVPETELAHVNGQATTYYFSAAAGGLRDLAGNGLVDGLAPTTCIVDPAQADAFNGGRLTRFSSPDEEAPFGTPQNPLPEWSGQQIYDVARGEIGPRPVVRFARTVDRTQGLPSLMIPVATGVQTPLNGLGARMQTVWRYADAGLGLTDLATVNVDVEGLSWSPLGGQVVADHFGEFEMRLSHGRVAPDETLDPLSLFPFFPNSGMRQVYDNNDMNGTVEVVHEKALGYTVSPADAYVAATGTPLMPFPLNRDVPAGERKYYTWRDTAIATRAAPQSGGVPTDLESFINGTTPPANPYFPGGDVASIGLPLLMDFLCFPDQGAVGLNSFDVSIAINTSAKPYFRAFSAGGVNLQGQVVTVDPELETNASGGFNPQSTPPGQPTFGLDPTSYVGAMDLVVRVSRAYSVWFEASSAAGALAQPAYAEPVLEPAQQPAGTHIELAFRGATAVTNTDALTNALTLDQYGDHYDPAVSPPNHASGQANLGVAFLAGDRSWRDSVSSIDGAQYYQVRLTLIADPVTGRTPRLSSLALAWQ